MKLYTELKDICRESDIELNISFYNNNIIDLELKENGGMPIYSIKSTEEEDHIQKCLIFLIKRRIQEYIGPVEIGIDILDDNLTIGNIIINNKIVYQRYVSISEYELLKMYWQSLKDKNAKKLTYYFTSYLFDDIKSNIQSILQLNKVDRIITQDNFCCWIEEDQIQCIYIRDIFTYKDQNGLIRTLNIDPIKQKLTYRYIDHMLDEVDEEGLKNWLYKYKVDNLVLKDCKIVYLNSNDELKIDNAGEEFNFYNSDTNSFMNVINCEVVEC
jgi:hypothetical protein